MFWFQLLPKSWRQWSKDLRTDTCLIPLLFLSPFSLSLSYDDWKWRPFSTMTCVTKLRVSQFPPPPPPPPTSPLPAPRGKPQAQNLGIMQNSLFDLFFFGVCVCVCACVCVCVCKCARTHGRKCVDLYITCLCKCEQSAVSVQWTRFDFCGWTRNTSVNIHGVWGLCRKNWQELVWLCLLVESGCSYCTGWKCF